MGKREAGVRERWDLINEALVATVSAKLWKVFSKEVTQVHVERITLATMLSIDWGTGGVEYKGPVRKLLQ